MNHTDSSRQAAALPAKKRKVLYLFAGPERKSGVGSMLTKLGFVVIEVDILKNRLHDLSIGTTQQRWLQRIAAGEFDAVLASPPCSTYSRAVWANAFGP